MEISRENEYQAVSIEDLEREDIKDVQKEDSPKMNVENLNHKDNKNEVKEKNKEIK